MRRTAMAPSPAAEAAAGLPVGRQPGARDRRQRKRSGYVAAWEPGGKRRLRAIAS